MNRNNTRGEKKKAHHLSGRQRRQGLQASSELCIVRSDLKGPRRESVGSASGQELYQLVLPSWGESFARLRLEVDFHSTT